APLPGATVAIRAAAPAFALGALTDSAGRYTIPNVPAGRHEIVAQHVGFRTRSVWIDVVAGETTVVQLVLEERAVLLPSVVVSATRERQRLAETAASVGVISGETLRAQKPTHPSEVMGQIPGVWVSVTGGEGHMTSIRQPKSTNPVYLFLEDGVPTRSTGFFNHNALYEVNVPQAERIEVLKGPATALYGSDAIGGVVNVETRAPSFDPSAEAYAEGGASGYRRLLLAASDTRGGNGLRADVNLTATDGWRDGTGYDRQSATLRWDRDLGGGAVLRTTLTASRIDQQTAGASSLLRDDYVNDPTLNYTPISLREVRAARLTSAFEKLVGATLVSITPFARWNEMAILPNWSLTYDPTYYTTGHSSAGVLAKVRRDFDRLRMRVIAGFDVDHSPGGRTEHQVSATRDGEVFSDYALGDVIYDYDVTFRSISPYLHAETNVSDRLHLMAGVRYDHMAYRYDSELEPLSTGRWRRPADTRVSYDYVSPKLGATYDFGRALNVYGNHTRGFRAPSEGQLFRQGAAANTTGLEPVIANSTELGARGELYDRVGYSIAAYSMTVENDVLSYVEADGTRETQNAGETLHRGIEAGLGVRLTDDIRADVSWSLSRHTYEAWSPRPDVDYAGNRIESAPGTLLNTRVGWKGVALEWNRIGSYWLDAENTHRYDGHGLVNIHANVPVAGSVRVVARMLNIMDTRFAESASYTAVRGEELAPGMPRSVYVGVQYRWNQGGTP
ncbi:MAG: TonB-dependent receptor, partial [Gemmatimonadota bacterium]